MIKQLALCGFLLGILFCSVGCSIKSEEQPEPVKSGSASYEETTVVSDTEATAATSEKIIETTLQTPQQSVSSAENSADESDLDMVIWKAPNGELFYKKDAVQNGSILEFDKAIYRPSTGFFYDSFTNPELFDPETYDFLGELIEYDESDWRCIQTGDTINGYTVERAEMSFNIIDEEVYFKANTITFQEDVILTGYLMYFSYDEPTTIIAGDFVMIPDESFQGMPRVNIYPFRKIIDGKIWENPDEFVPLAYYTDAPVIPLGNLYRDYDENEELKALVGDGTESRKIRVEVTIDHLSLCFADMMGDSWTSGKIVSVKKIQ